MLCDSSEQMVSCSYIYLRDSVRHISSFWRNHKCFVLSELLNLAPKRGNIMGNDMRHAEQGFYPLFLSELFQNWRTHRNRKCIPYYQARI